MFNPSGAFPTQPTSLCGSVTNNGVQVNTVVPTAGAPVQWQITFELHVVSDQVSSPAAGDAALDSEVMNWSFQVDRPGAPTCQAQPMNASNPQAYFPADGAILFDPSRIAPVFASPNDAPAFQLMTFAKLGYVDETGGLAGTCPGCAPLVSQGFLVNPTGTTSNYTFVARNQVGTVQTVGAATPPPGSASGSTPRNSGFLNSPPGSGFGSGGANDYQVTFVMADATGLLALPYPNAAAQDACTLANVETAAIQGFLKTGSGCFIATAAFESYESPPVRMLRRFRDQVLLKSSLGERFVQWYYDWSPPAADWLNDHGWFRIPVLTALIPLQVFAWICLNPLVTLLFATLSGAIAMPWVRRRARLRDAV